SADPAVPSGSCAAGEVVVEPWSEAAASVGGAAPPCSAAAGATVVGAASPAAGPSSGPAEGVAVVAAAPESVTLGDESPPDEVESPEAPGGSPAEADGCTAGITTVLVASDASSNRSPVVPSSRPGSSAERGMTGSTSVTGSGS